MTQLLTRPATSRFQLDAGGTVVLTPPSRPKLLSAPPPPPPPVPITHAAYMEEYGRLAAQVGIKPPHIEIERFRVFLLKEGITVFALGEVKAYMDKKAAAESVNKSGWEWRPLRAKDQRKGLAMGTPARREAVSARGVGPRTGHGIVSIPASDYYRGQRVADSYTDIEAPFFVTTRGHNLLAPSSLPYDRLIPLHALRKVAAIESGFTGDVAFFVCDYAPIPAVTYPDPFLMAVIANPDIDQGVGRFVIDFWDEPGFGIEKQLA